MLAIRHRFSPAFLSLIEKEFVLILRNRHILFLILFPTTVQLIIIGFALHPGIEHLRVAINDECRTTYSRNLIFALRSTGLFCPYEPIHAANLDHIFSNDRAKAVLFIPRNFQAKLDRFHFSPVQFILDGSDAYTAGLARGYLTEATINSNVQGASRPKASHAVQANIVTLF